MFNKGSSHTVDMEKMDNTYARRKFINSVPAYYGKEKETSLLSEDITFQAQ